MKKQLICLGTALALTAALTVPAAASAMSYSDVTAGAWYEPAVTYCLNHGLMTSATDTTFAPNGPVDRGMAVTMLHRLAGSPAPKGSAGFTDVPASADYAAAVNWAAETGVTSGTTPTTFAPSKALNRQEFAVFLWNMAGKPSGSGKQFADQSSIRSWAVDAISWANANGIILGKTDGSFDPLATITRAQAATILMSYDYSVPRDINGRLCAANGIARMQDGSMLVTDMRSQQLWKVTDGKSVLYAGAATPNDPYGQPLGGKYDAGLKDSRFRTPWAVAAYKDGWAVTESDSNTLRLLTDSGVTTIDISLDHPTGLAADGSGNLYIANTGAGTIIKLDASGKSSTVASGLSDPTGLCWSSGTLYICETGNDRIVTLSGSTVTPFAGSGNEGSANGEATAAAFSSPQGVAVGSDGTVYISDTGNSAIRQVKNGTVSTLASRDKASDDLALIRPAGLLVSGKTLYVCDNFACQLVEIPIR